MNNPPPHPTPGGGEPDRCQHATNKVPAKSAAEFRAFLDEYTGADLRFVDPHFAGPDSRHSGPVRLTFRRQVGLICSFVLMCFFFFPANDLLLLMEFVVTINDQGAKYGDQ